jgi:hypothetical protein
MEKRGTVVRGWAELRVGPGPTTGSDVLWREELTLRGLPRAADPLVAAVGRFTFGRVLDGLTT